MSGAQARRLLAVMIVWVLGSLGAPAGEAPVRPLTPEEFARLQALIKPDPGEDSWTRIPWLSSLWEARRRAAAEGKPLLLWEMDGHPLGCT